MNDIDNISICCNKVENVIDFHKECVFFCEGPSEALMLKHLSNKLKDKKVILRPYKLPDFENDKFFTPKRITDFCLRVINYAKNIKPLEYWPYEYKDPYKLGIYHWNYENKTIIDDLRKDVGNQIKVCVLVDTDVFYKSNWQSFKRYENFGDVDTSKYASIKDYREILEKNNKYLFLEQELNFEDFFVLCFIKDDEKYKKWFTERFGATSLRNGLNLTDRNYQSTKNDEDNGDSIKKRLRELLCETDEKWLDDWLRKQDFNIDDFIQRCKNRIKVNKGGLPNGWPYRFGLIDLLDEYL